MTCSEPCHRAKLYRPITNWKCQNNIRTLNLSAQSLDLNPVENLCRKNNLGDSQETSVNQARVAHHSLEPLVSSRPPRQSRQAVRSIQTRCRSNDDEQGLVQIY